MIYFGIDPGKSGAIAAITDGTLGCMRFDETERDIADWLAMLSCRQATSHPCFAFIERVSAMPKQGVSSTFKFGDATGFARGLLVANRIPYDRVTPRQWQAALGCLSKGNKNVTKAKAQQLFPDYKITHHTADAILLAEYCRRKRAGAALEIEPLTERAE